MAILCNIASSKRTSVIPVYHWCFFVSVRPQLKPRDSVTQWIVLFIVNEAATAGHEIESAVVICIDLLITQRSSALNTQRSSALITQRSSALNTQRSSAISSNYSTFLSSNYSMFLRSTNYSTFLSSNYSMFLRSNYSTFLSSQF